MTVTGQKQICRTARYWPVTVTLDIYFLETEGMAAGSPRLVAYVSRETHTWIDKAADLFGLGANAVRWIGVNDQQQMDIVALEAPPDLLQFWLIRNPGSCPVNLPGRSVLLTRSPGQTFREDGCPAPKFPLSHNFDGIQGDPPINYYAFGMQNSRGFRALKVWLALRQVGRAGYIEMIGDDIALARALYRDVDNHPALQAVTQSLSIATFRFVPPDLPADPVSVEPYLNELNAALLNQLQTSGAAFVSNALVDGKSLLRARIVNFRTTLVDIEALPVLVAQLGNTLDATMRPPALQSDWNQRINMKLLHNHRRPPQHTADPLGLPVSIGPVLTE